jgi:hypothetical protein
MKIEYQMIKLYNMMLKHPKTEAFIYRYGRYYIVDLVPFDDTKIYSVYLGPNEKIEQRYIFDRTWK